MTQEFKDQNALEVEGQLLCRHFLWGKCIKASLKHYFIYLFIKFFGDPVGTNLIHLHFLLFYWYYWYFFNLTLKYPANAKILPFFMQGDECQLKHVKVYNGLIKDLCKFYVTGFCMKAESCPYMHDILSLFYCYMSQTKVCWTIHELCCSFGPQHHPYRTDVLFFLH